MSFLLLATQFLCLVAHFYCDFFLVGWQQTIRQGIAH